MEKELKQLGTLFGAKIYIEINKESKETADFQVLQAEKYLRKLWEKQDEEKLVLTVKSNQ